MKVSVREKLGVETDNEKGEWANETHSHTLRTILPYPTWEALAGAINRVAGAVVGAETDLGASPPIPATWTHCKTQKQNITLQNNTDLHINTYMQRLVKSINVMTLNFDTLLWAKLFKQTQLVKGCVNIFL